MRKLFSILAVALLALSAHATVVTHNLEFSRFSKYGEGEEATVSDGTITATVAWKGAQYWFGEGEYAFDASEYEVLVLELASTSTVGVNYVIEYADATASNDITIPAGQTSAQLPLKSNKIKNIVIKLTENGTATLSHLYFKGYAGKVKEEAVTISKNDDNGHLEFGTKGIQVWSGSFSSLDLQVDDKLVIKYALSGNDDQFRIYACTNDNETYTFTGLDGLVNPQAGTTSIAFPLNSADLAQLTSKGIKIDGKNMTITGVSVLKHALLWSGTKAVASWDTDVEITDFSDFKDGNKLCVRLTSLTIDGESQVALTNNYNNFNPELNYIFQAGDAASDENPLILEFPITHKMLNQLQGKSLRVRGKNFTMTDIFIKEGTPTNTVAGYLNVTEAGMATLVLPFDVPSLPEGVQAYNLTNNGDATIWAEEVSSLTADKPVLIIADAGEYEFVSEEGASDDITSKTGTFTNGALVGTYTTIDPLAQTTGGNYNYILQNGSDGVGFYQVRDAPCSVAPYRAYLSCGHDASNNGANFAPRMRIVFHKDAPTGVENTESAKMGGSTKFLRDGQLIILRNGVEYNANGQMTK